MVADGAVTLEGQRLGPRDGAMISDLETLTIAAEADSELLLADLP